MAPDPGERGVASERRRRLRLGPFRLTDWAQPSGARLGWHHHEAPSLSLALEGGWCESYRGRSVECRPGDVVVKPAGEGHRDRVADAGARTLLVELSGPVSGELGEVLRQLDEPRVRREAGSTSLVWRCRDELRRDDAWVPLALESLALELVVRVARAPEPPEPGAPPPWLRRGLEYLRETLVEPVSLTDVARVCGVHPAHLARVFRRHLGCSVGEWLREARLCRAIDELRRGGLSIADAARRAGFYDHSHFARVLWRRKRLRPRDLRPASRP